MWRWMLYIKICFDTATDYGQPFSLIDDLLSASYILTRLSTIHSLPLITCVNYLLAIVISIWLWK